MRRQHCPTGFSNNAAREIATDVIALLVALFSGSQSADIGGAYVFNLSVDLERCRTGVRGHVELFQPLLNLSPQLPDGVRLQTALQTELPHVLIERIHHGRVGRGRAPVRAQIPDVQSDIVATDLVLTGLGSDQIRQDLRNAAPRDGLARGQGVAKPIRGELGESIPQPVDPPDRVDHMVHDGPVGRGFDIRAVRSKSDPVRATSPEAA